MPKLLYYIRTPLGEFASSGAAGRAHKVDRGVILKRCETDPENYQKIPKPTKPRPVYTAEKKTAWPLSWFQYRNLPNDDREAIYQAWCGKNNQNPDSDTAANLFFDAMDLIQDEETRDSISD